MSTDAAVDPRVQAKKAAGYQAIDTHMKPEFKAVGIGSGSTVVFCVERIGQLTKEGKLPPTIRYVPTGFQSKQLLIAAGLIVAEVDQYKIGDLDIVFDGADEIDSTLQCIKGGGACHLQEKIVGLCAKKFIIVADYTKVSQKLGTRWVQGVPVEVIPLALAKVTAELESLGAKKVTLRSGGKAKAGPIVTDNGNLVLDTYFGEIEPRNVHDLDQSIKRITGVVETGLFTYGSEAYIGKSDGTFEVLRK